MPHGPSRSTMTSGSPTCKISGFCSRNTDGTDEVKNNHQKRFADGHATSKACISRGDRTSKTFLCGTRHE